MPKRRYIVTLAPAEREELQSLVSTGKAAAYRIKHAHMLLATDENGLNLTGEENAAALGCHRNTVANVRQRFVEQGLQTAL